MAVSTKGTPARERILKKAEELFYTQGYQNTGINQIIEESGVAKATFYANFPSKDDLCITYLRTAGERETQIFRDTIAKQKTPLAKFLCTAELLVPWLEETKYRGCAFLNMIPEVPNHKDPIRNQAARFYTQYEKIMEKAAQDLIDSDKERYGHLRARQVAKQYLILVAGGLSLSALHHDVQPMKEAVRRIRELAGE